MGMPAAVIDAVNRLPMGFALLAVGVGLLLAVLVFGQAARRSGGFFAGDYRAKPLLSAWELRVLADIRRDLPPGFYACPQVRLADLLAVTEREPSLRRSALNRVASKSVDFAIIDAGGRVALVVELDDKSHDRPDRQRRDQLVADVLAHCGIALLRVRPWQPVAVARHLATKRGAAVA